MTQSNHELVRRFVEAENAHDIEALSQLATPDARVYGNGVLVADSWAGYRPIVEATLAAFPDSRREVSFMASDDDIIGFRWTVTGTHRAPWRGIPASGNPVTICGTSWLRNRDGRIAEAWFDMDLAGPIQQMTAK